MDILEKEIQIALNPLIDFEERERSTKYFNDFINSLDSIFLSLRLYLSSNNLTVKFASSIVLRHTLNKLWPVYCNDTHIKKEIHELIINCIKSKGDYVLFSYFLYSIENVIATDSEDWIELQQFYNFQISEGTEETIVYPIMIASLTAGSISYNMVTSKLVYFLSLAQFSFGVDNDFLIIFASKLISKLFTRLSAEDLFHLSGPFEFVMKKWGYSIIEGDDELSFWLNQIVNEVIHNQKIPFTADTFMNFLSDLSSRDLSIFSLHLLYGNMTDFLKFYGSQIEGIGVQIEVILNTASSLFENNFLNAQSEMFFIMNAFNTILKTTNAEDSISYLFEYKEDVNHIISNEDRLNELASYLLAVLMCVETSFEFCLPYINVLIETVFETLHHSHFCIQEISIEIVRRICSSLHYLHDFDNNRATDAFFDPFYHLLQSESELVVFRTIRSLIELLHVATIDSNLVGPTIDLLYNLYNNNINKYIVLEAISSIVFSAEMKVRAYSMNIYETAKNALLSNDSILIATGIESIANLFFYCHDILDSKEAEVFDMLLSFADSASGDVRSAVAFGFRVFLKNEEKWKEIFLPHFSAILAFIDDTLEKFIGETTRSCLLDVLRLMKVIVKHYSQTVKEVLNKTQISDTELNNRNHSSSLEFTIKHSSHQHSNNLKHNHSSNQDSNNLNHSSNQDSNNLNYSSNLESNNRLNNLNHNNGLNLSHGLNTSCAKSHNTDDAQSSSDNASQSSSHRLLKMFRSNESPSHGPNKILVPAKSQNQAKILNHKANKILNQNLNKFPKSSSYEFQRLISRDGEEAKDDSNDEIVSCYEKWFSYALLCFDTIFIPLHIAAISLATNLYQKRSMNQKMFTSQVTHNPTEDQEEESKTTLKDENKTTLKEVNKTTFKEESKTTLKEVNKTTFKEEPKTTLKDGNKIFLKEESNTNLEDEFKTTLKSEFFTLLEDDFNDESPYITSASINAFAKLTEDDLSDLPNDSIVEKTINLLCKFDSLHRSPSNENGFDDQQIYIINYDEDDDNNEGNRPKMHHHNHSLPMLVKKSIYHYFSVLTSTDQCVSFPLDLLVEHSKVIDEDDSERTLYYYTVESLYFNTIKNTKNFSINVINNMIEMEKEGRYSYLNGKSRTIIFDGFNKCDLYSWPSSLISLDIITQDLFKNGLIELCEELIQWIERYIDSLFKTQYSHQSAYFQTVYPAMSIILTFCCAKRIDILKWIPLIIKKFPIRSEFGFADTIVREITELYLIAPLKMNPFAPHLMYILVGILALPDDEFELYNFKNDTLSNAVQMVKKLANLNPQTFVIISSSFLDVNSKPMFEKRMAQY